MILATHGKISQLVYPGQNLSDGRITAKGKTMRFVRAWGQ